MCWKEQGGQATLTFRALLQSNLFDSAWEMLGAVYYTEIKRPKNIVMFPGKHKKNRQWLIYTPFILEHQ